MERNANDTFNTQNSGTSASGSSSTSTSDTGFSRDTSADSGGIADRARSTAGAMGDKLSDVGSTVKERAGGIKHTLADVLESGADRLRQRGVGGGQIAGAVATGSSAHMIAGDDRIAQTTNQLAGGLQASADWLRDADLDSVKMGIERQVKEHPGRTLAIAVGVGYLLGKALRK